MSANDVVLQWSGVPRTRFEVQWTSSPASSFRNTFSNNVTSPDGLFSFRDDGSQSGGLASAHFYRLRQLP